MKYILDGKEPRLEPDLLRWAEWIGKGNRRVANTVLKSGIRISTVFLGIDHAICGTPVLFESMIFGGPNDGDMRRYFSWNEAEEGHSELVKRESEQSKKL